MKKGKPSNLSRRMDVHGNSLGLLASKRAFGHDGVVHIHCYTFLCAHFQSWNVSTLWWMGPGMLVNTPHIGGRDA